MKNLLFVTNSLIGGGSERVLAAVASELAGRGHRVSILSYRDGDTYPLHPDIRVRTLHNEQDKGKRIAAIRRTVRELAPDCVIAFEYFVNMQAVLACLGLHTRLVISERNDPAREGGGFPKRYIRNFLYRFCDVLVCQTPDARDYFPGYVRRRAVLIPNPVKSDLPEPWQGERSKTVVNFCRLQPQKNLILLADAFALFRQTHPEYRLAVYGNGDGKEALQRHIREAGLEDRVDLYPSCPDVHRRILDAAMFVSSSDYEGLSNSMLEAMAIGLPTVCTDCPVGGARMVIRDGENGLLVPVGDREALAAAMCRVADDRALAETLSQNGRTLREKLSIGVIADEWERLIT